MTEIVVALISVAGALVLAWVQRRWERKSLTSAWQEQADELARKLEEAHDERIGDLKAQLRAANRTIESFSRSRKAKPDDT